MAFDAEMPYSAAAEIYERTPVCFAGARDFRRPEILTAAGSSTPDWSPVKEKWNCEMFTPLRPGLTPKEHREALDREAERNQQAAIQLFVWEREDKRDKRLEDWHKDEVESLKGQFRWQIVWFGAAVVIATLVGSIIQAGWIARPW